MTNVNYTRNIYNKFGKAYHEKRTIPSKNFWNEFIEMPAMERLLKSEVKNKEVLDLGCGSGIFTSKLQLWGAKAVGSDLSKALIEIARKSYPKLSFFVEDAQKTSFKNSRFDIVSSSLMVHYIKNLDKLFGEVSRILKKDGVFVFSIHHPTNEIVKKIKLGNVTEYALSDYFNTDKYTWNMLEGMDMISYHHTFEDISTALFKAGFVIELILEPKPDKSSKSIDEKAHSRTSKCPSFAIIKAKKVK
jgi:ubiquinone/menaquinone biosynthesis C-methylase UbiE